VDAARAFRIAGRQEEVLGLHPVVGRVLKHRTGQIVRAALDLHVDRRAASHPLIGIEAVGDHANRLDRFEAGAVRLNLLKKLVNLRDAVEPHHMLFGGCPLTVIAIARVGLLLPPD
jgi:hypothetical protein